jgi:hypothetical protein
MSQNSREFRSRVRRARDRLEDQFLDHPDVKLIDIGYPPEQDEGTEEIALRIHVREHWMKAKPGQRLAFPKDMDGIPVIVMLGDYQLDTDTSELDED